MISILNAEEIQLLQYVYQKLTKAEHKSSELKFL